MLPAAHAILWFMAAFLLLWAASLQWRAVVRRSGGRQCPACRTPVSETAGTCEACGFASERPRDFRRARLHWPLIGAAAGATAAAAVAAYLGAWVQSWSQEAMWEESPALGAWASAALGVAAFGLVLAAWSWRGDRSRGRKRCPKCWYDMSGGGLKCPECGHEAAAVRQLFRPRRRRFAAVVGLVILAASYGVWVTPRVDAGGWVAAVPTTVLIAGLTWAPDSVIFDDGSRDEDWTLTGRFRERTWSWQDDWLEWRCRRILRGRPGPRALARALAFKEWDPSEPEDRALSERTHRRILEFLTAPSDQFRAHAERLFVPESWHPLPEQKIRALVAPHVPSLTQGLTHPDPSVRSWCASYLASAGDPAVDAIPAFIEAIRLASTARSLPLELAICLKQLCRSSAKCRDAAMASLSDDDPVVLQMLAFALSYPQQDHPAVPRELLRLLEHPNDSVAIYAASGLVRIGAEPDRTMSALIQQARSDRGNRYMFARMVAEFGDQARPHLPELIELVSAPADGTRLGGVLAIRALAEIAAFDLRPALPALRACLGPQTSPKLSQAVSEAILLIERMYPEMGPTP